MGNLASVKNAFKSVGYDCDIVEDASRLAQYDRVVLPGVGTFRSMMQNLDEKRFSGVIKKHIASGKPFMGICLGMQVLFETGDEFEETTGLSVLKGHVTLLPQGASSVPNVGWWDVDGDYGAFSSELSDEDTFYFVHSYICKPVSTHHTLTIDFNDHRLVVAIRQDNVFAYQFHPEKSQVSGQKLLRSFVEAI